MKKLLLYSQNLSPAQATELSKLVGKPAQNISVGLIENAADVEPNSANWLEHFRQPLRAQGYQLEQIDLRNWLHQQTGLAQKLGSKDVIWIGGGNTFYLRWILQQTSADQLITAHVGSGKVYAGWSAGAVIAGPTLRGFDLMDPTDQAPQLIWTGLNLTPVAVVPHQDNDQFKESAMQVDQLLKKAGHTSLLLNDDQAVLIRGDVQKII